MPQLVAPTTAVHRSFLAAWDELDPEDDRWMGVFVANEDRTRRQLEDPGEFDRFVGDLLRDALPDAPRPPDWCPSTMLWYVDGDEWLGRLSIRHVLTRFLLEIGGHIGYVVRPSARRKGLATAMLAESLPMAAGMGIDPVLITCDTDNDASRKVIESCGGEFEDERHGKLRYWVPTTLR
jgi:predicted acetyltransferase